MEKPQKEITTIYARDLYVLCPYCGELLYVWVDDPRGVHDECDFCGKELQVSKQAVIVYGDKEL